jgi:AraC family ethanolamine operon transcriptional activator
MTATASTSLLPASGWVHTLQAHDVDELAQGQPGWALRYDQLSRGSFDGQLVQAQLPGVRLVMEISNRAVLQRGAVGQGQQGFGLPLASAAEARFAGQRLAADAMLIGPSEDVELCAPPGFGLLGLVVERPLLCQLWEHMYQRAPGTWLSRPLVVPVRPGAAAAVRELHLRTLGLLRARPALRDDAQALHRLRDDLLMEWLEAIPSPIDTTQLDRALARRRVVDRACARLCQPADDPPTVLQVCAAIGVSPRKLAYCFRDVLGTTPLQYQRALRLNGARRELRRGGREPSLGVQDVAARWGFWHLGGFAADYRHHFGELPSQTLQRARD